MGMANTGQFIWRYAGIDVMYSQNLDGGGIVLAPAFVAFVKNYFGAQRRFRTVFEWCAGPGFIGFALLAEGICDSICLADINPSAIDCVRRTIETNHLQERVRCYVSDNLLSVPDSERFDLVVGNPPSYCAMNPAHPLYNYWQDDLRPHDPGWQIHGAFYSQIAPFLNPGAFVLVEEVEPFSREVFQVCDAPAYDIRPEPPAGVFIKMMANGGLVHVGDFEFPTDFGDKIKMWMQISQKPA